MKERPNRSDHYQWTINEIPVAGEYMDLYNNSQSINAALNPFEYNERYLELEDELTELTLSLIDDVLTQRQKDIIHLSLEGKTQMEIAKILGCNQSSVTKSLHGNLDYNSSNVKKRYGGSMKKMKAYVMENPRIKEILEEMREILDEKL